MNLSLLSLSLMLLTAMAQDEELCVPDGLPPQNITTAPVVDVAMGANFTDLTVCAFQRGDLFRLTFNGTRVVRAFLVYNESQGIVGATVTNDTKSLLSTSVASINGTTVSAILKSDRDCGDSCFLNVTLVGPRANFAYNNYSLHIVSWRCLEDSGDPQTDSRYLPTQVPFLSLGSPFGPFTLCGLEVDWFRLVIVTPQVVTINLTSDGIQGANIAFFEKNGDIYDQVGFSDTGRIDFLAAKNTYYIRFSTNNFVEGWGTYSFSVSPSGGYPGVNATTGQVTTGVATTGEATTKMRTSESTTGSFNFTIGESEQPSNSSTMPVTTKESPTTEEQLVAIVDNRNFPAFAQGIVITVGACLLLCCTTGLALVLFRHKKRQMKHVFCREGMSDRDSFGSMDSPPLSRGISKRFLDSIPYSEIVYEKQIGEGSSGVVYKASWRGTPVAVKQLHTILAGKDAIQGFKSEARLMRSLRAHPNCVLFLGVTVPPDPICIVTEYLKNGSLFHYLQREPLSIEAKVKLMSGIATGILHLHSEGIVHRDLASRNILLTSDLTPKVSDFGMSRKLTEDNQAGTTESRVGPLKWMAPESITDAEYSFASDAWMFAIVCWEILTGEIPYGALPPLQAASKVVTEDLRLEIPSSCPEHLAELLKHCWNKNPKDRPNFEEICNQMKALLEELCGASEDEAHMSSQKQTESSGQTHDSSLSTSTVTAPLCPYSKSPQHLVSETVLDIREHYDGDSCGE